MQLVNREILGVVGSRGLEIRYSPETYIITLRDGAGLEIHTVFVCDCQNLMEDPICFVPYCLKRERR